MFDKRKRMYLREEDFHDIITFLKVQFSQKNVKLLLHQMDTNKNGQVDLEEFKAFFLRCDKSL